MHGSEMCAGICGLRLGRAGKDADDDLWLGAWWRGRGGVFLIPYLVFLFACGIPLFLLEMSIGQYTSQGGISCWRKICPLFQGLGYGAMVMLLYSSIYYIIIMAWAFFYLFSSFSSELPWASCNNYWNTETCDEFGKKDHFSNFSIPENATSPVKEFWERRVLNLTSSVYELGSVRWELALCLLLSWIICYFSVWKGIKSTGKVVYFTATFPYVMLVVLLVHGLMLPGAAEGIRFYLYPDITHLKDPQVGTRDNGKSTHKDFFVWCGWMLELKFSILMVSARAASLLSEAT
ncbi:hypothetical protein QTP86_025485, partial [Hemibagrus guttatus]